MIPRLLTLLVWLLWASPFGVHAAYAKRYGDLAFAASGQSLLDGNNMFTVIASNAYNVKVTNNLAFNLPESITLTHDLNGNLTGDGTRTFYYDAEDRLTNVFVPAQWKTEFVYDGLGRRRIIKDYTWQSGAWAKTNETRVIFDGMLPIQERDGNNVVRASYTRGLDLSLSLDGAGGIGGLLARTDANGSAYYHADGIGNITALIDGNQNIVARYLHDPFGRTIGQWGPLAEPNIMRAFSMPSYGKGGIIGYWARFYDPVLSRWLGQDPIGEMGGINLYRFIENAPINAVDPWGLVGFPVWDGGGRADAGSFTRTMNSWLGFSNPGEEMTEGQFAQLALISQGLHDELNFQWRDPSAPSESSQIAAHDTETARDFPVPNRKPNCPSPQQTTVYRVEGSPNTRIIIGKGGQVSVQGDKMLFLNFGDEARAKEFLAKRLQQGMSDAQIKSFQVPESFLKELQEAAVPESMAHQFPNSPLLVDPTKAPNQFGLRHNQINSLQAQIIQGTGKVQGH